MCVAGIWFGPPCASWSSARPGLPDSSWCRIRTLAFLDGAPGLSDKCLAQIAAGNATAKATQSLVRACIAVGTPCAAENPRRSLLWHSKFLRDLIPYCSSVFDVDMCAFGAPWRKATRVATCSCDDDPALHKVCAGKAGQCSWSGRPHVILDNPRACKRAAEYPQAFARGFANLLFKSWENRLSSA